MISITLLTAFATAASAQGAPAPHNAPSDAPSDAPPDAPPDARSNRTSGAGQGSKDDYDRVVLEALAAYRAGEWAAARAGFERAHALRPTARTLRTIGMAAFNQGEMLTALTHLQASLEDDRRPLTAEQRKEVSRLIRRAGRAVGRLRLDVHPEQARVEVDGLEPTRLSDGHLLLEPGRHELVVRAEAHETHRQHLRVAAGDRATLEVRLERVAPAPVVLPVAAPASGAPSVARVSPEPSPVDHTWSWIALSVGAAGAITGGVATGLALSERSALDDACDDRVCGPDQHDRLDRYDTLRTVAIAGGVLGALGLATGTVLLLREGEPEREPRIEAVLGPAYAGVRGRL
ncbi:MAG: hypothetical protein PVI30_25560 [Myxococcales bacterium]